MISSPSHASLTSNNVAQAVWVPIPEKENYSTVKNYKTKVLSYGLGFCCLVFVLTLILYPTDFYHGQIRPILAKLFGKNNSHYDNPLLLGVGLALSSFIAAIIFTCIQQQPNSFHSSHGKSNCFQVLKRKLSPNYRRFIRLTYGEILFLVIVLVLNLIWFVCFGLRYIQRINDKHNQLLKLAKPKSKDLQVISNYSYNLLEAFGKTLGFNLALCLTFLLFPATRGSYWIEQFNLSYFQGIKYHRWLGYTCFVLVVGHMLPYYISWWQRGVFWEEALPCFNCDIKTKGKHQWVNTFGEMAFLCMLVITITSTAWVRRHYYEVFYYTHFLFILAIIFAILHWRTFVWWMYPSCALYIVHRIMSHAQSNTPVKIVCLESLQHGIVRLVIHVHQEYKRHIAGQMIYLKVPQISKLQWHPFSISTSPYDSTSTLSVYCKDLGEWTRQFHQLALDTQKNSLFPCIYVDGYYGLQTNTYDKYPVVVLVGGGIGVTPLLSIFDDLYFAKLYGKKIICQTVHLVWTVREFSLLKEFEFILDRARTLDPQGEFFQFHIALTRQENQDFDYIPPSWNSNTLIENQPNAKPYQQSIVSTFEQIVVFFSVFLPTGVLLYVLRYNSKKENIIGGYWPLQRLVESCVCFVGAVVGYLAIHCLQRYRSKTSKTLSYGSNVVQPVLQTPPPVYPSHTTVFENSNMELGKSNLLNTNLMEKHNVSHLRIDIAQVLDTIKKSFLATSMDRLLKIGVFASGPTSFVEKVDEICSTSLDIFDFHHEVSEL